MTCPRARRSVPIRRIILTIFTVVLSTVATMAFVSSHTLPTAARNRRNPSEPLSQPLD